MITSAAVPTPSRKVATCSSNAQIEHLLGQLGGPGMKKQTRIHDE